MYNWYYPKKADPHSPTGIGVGILRFLDKWMFCYSYNEKFEGHKAILVKNYSHKKTLVTKRI